MLPYYPTLQYHLLWLNTVDGDALFITRKGNDNHISTGFPANANFPSWLTNRNQTRLTKLLLLSKLLPSTDIFFARLLGVGLTCYVIWYLINKAYQMT